ncbi:MAG: class I SAM-dependent methyltransferase [Alphaproteobacteria bacterium]|nr:class I SAM-dependent methyltransferase [Alphaproteobacteria bacterium]
MIETAAPPSPSGSSSQGAGFRANADGSGAAHIDSTRLLREIINSYESPVVRAYCWGRFQILRLRFLDEVGQYLPSAGNILDVGCGFGLFSLFFAASHPDRIVHGFDLNPKRIEMAKRSAERLGLKNVTFHAENAVNWMGEEKFDAAYMLDIIHHIPRNAVDGLLTELRKRLSPTGVLVIKDLTDRPASKTAFTWALDKAMDFRTPVHYWSMDALAELLRGKSLRVFVHQMVDYLAYPHVSYICRPI